MSYSKQAWLEKIEKVIANGKYKADWDSMANIEIPDWYLNAKFGIFMHWGVYSVPEFCSEWYPRDMYIQEKEQFKHHVETFGEHKNFGYKEFVDKFTAPKFNAEEWLDIYEKSGAKYIMPVAEHHDGFQMYKSEISEWNAFEKGPKRDVLGELKAAAEKRDIKLAVSSHRIEHWWFMGNGRKFDSDFAKYQDENGKFKEGDLYWPSVCEEEDGTWPGDKMPRKFLNPEKHPEYLEESKAFAEDWLVRCCELVDNYKPAIFYFDWWIWVKPLKPYLKKFAAYYYNRMAEFGLKGAINYKTDSMAYGTGVYDIERGQSENIMPRFWQTDTAIARNSWSYTPNNNFKSSRELICDLVDIVSKNGSLLLNVGPKSDGTISEEDKAVLLGIGEWLKVNGEAIYNTRNFKVFGEGPTGIKKGQFTDGEAKVFTSEDIRFTQNGGNLYATVLNFDGSNNGEINIKTLGTKSGLFQGFINRVEVLGFANAKAEFEITEEALKIKTQNVKSENPVVLKIILE